MQSDILCLQETHLKQPMLLKRLEEFNCIPYYSKHGLLICTKKNIQILKHIHFEEKNVEATLANMIIHGMDIIVLNVYVAPYATLNDSLHLLSKALCNTHSNQTIVIIGDFNINMLENNNKTNKLRSYMYNYNLHFLLDTNNNKKISIIDHIWSNITSSSKTFRLDAYWFDHDTICLIIEDRNATET